MCWWCVGDVDVVVCGGGVLVMCWWCVDVW